LFGYDYPLNGLFWTLAWFFLIFLYIWIVIVIIMDVFRSADLGGPGKAAWFVFVIVVPVIGVLVYLIARGGTMHKRQVARRRRYDEASQAEQRQAGMVTGSADALGQLYERRARGDITEDQFRAQKAQLLSGEGA
jgi:uncharacterized membrane protein